jgi:hypothetical protein
MDWRLRLPSALYRLALARAGSDKDLAHLVVDYLERYVTGTTEAQQTGASGGHARAASLTPERRSEIATIASHARTRANHAKTKERTE